MARKRLTDYLQDHYFWAFDATRNNGFPVFNPLFGFSRISAPEIALEVEQFKDGTYLYNRSVVKGGQVSPVVFERAASMFDSDFYEWIALALYGNADFQTGGTLGKIPNALVSGGRTSPRRNILVVQFTRVNAGKLSNARADLAVAGVFISIIAGTVIGAAATGQASVGLAAGAGAGAIAGGSAIGYGPFEFASRIPGRAWLLNNCLPVRYRAASDFDASSGQISLQELEVQPEYIEEFSLGVKP